MSYTFASSQPTGQQAVIHRGNPAARPARRETRAPISARKPNRQGTRSHRQRRKRNAGARLAPLGHATNSLVGRAITKATLPTDDCTQPAGERPIAKITHAPHTVNDPEIRAALTGQFNDAGGFVEGVAQPRPRFRPRRAQAVLLQW